MNHYLVKYLPVSATPEHPGCKSILVDANSEKAARSAIPEHHCSHLSKCWLLTDDEFTEYMKEPAR